MKKWLEDNWPVVLVVIGGFISIVFVIARPLNKATRADLKQHAQWCAIVLRADTTAQDSAATVLAHPSCPAFEVPDAD